MKTLYQAVWIDKDGAFRVNGSVAESKRESLRLSRNHVRVKNGAELHWIDEWKTFD